MEFQTIHYRIETLIKDLNLTNRSFALRIKVDPSVLHNIVSGRMSAPSFQVLEKILLTFDNIDARWLLTGIKTNGYDVKEKTATVIHDENNTYKNDTKERMLENEILNLKGQVEAYKNILSNFTSTNLK